MAVLLFLLTKGALTSLPTAHFVRKVIFCHSTNPACTSFSAEASAILLVSAKSTSLQFLFFSSFGLELCPCNNFLLAIFSVSYTLWHIWWELSILSSSFLPANKGAPSHSFFWVITWPMNWPDEVCCFSHPYFMYPLPLLTTRLFF